MSAQFPIHLTGLAGEYFTCAEICRQGFLALIAPKNNPLFDIVATAVGGNNSVFIQVKTRSAHNTQGWKLGIHNAKDKPDLFVVLVNLAVKDGNPPDFYIFKDQTLSSRIEQVYQEYLAEPKRNGEKRKEVGFRWFDEKNLNEEDRSRKNNWELIVNALKSDRTTGKC